MEAAYEVAARLVVKDGITAPLLKMAEQFAKVDKLITRINAGMEGMGAASVGMGKVTEEVSRMARAAEAANRQARTMGTVLGEAASRTNAGMGAAAASVSRLGTELALTTGRAERLMTLMAGGGGSFGGGGGNRALPGSRGNFPLPAGGWNMAGGGGGIIDMGPADIVPPGGGGGGGAGGGAGRSPWWRGNVPVPGFGSMITGAMAYKVAAGMVDNSVGFDNAYMHFQALNLGESANRRALNLANGANVRGVSQTEMMKALTETTGLFGSVDEAIKYTPTIAHLMKANTAVLGDKAPDLNGPNMMGLLKFIDRRGGFKNEAAFNTQLDLAERMLTGSGGRVTGAMLDQFSQRGGTAFRSLSDKGVMDMTGLLIEQGGSAAGVGLMSGYQNLIAGRTTIKAMNELAKYGIGTLEEQVIGGVGGQKQKRTILKNIIGEAEFQQSPVAWMQDYLLPQLASKGVTNKDDIVKIINDVMSNRTASNQTTISATQLDQLLRDRNIARGAMGSQQIMGMYDKSAQANIDEFKARWKDFLTVAGSDALPAFTNAVKDATKVIIGWSFLLGKNPDGPAASAEDAVDKAQGDPKNWVELPKGKDGFTHWGIKIGGKTYPIPYKTPASRTLGNPFKMPEIDMRQLYMNYWQDHHDDAPATMAASGSPNVAPAAGRPLVVHTQTTVKLDGAKLATGMSRATYNASPATSGGASANGQSISQGVHP